jgi:hypothetical protein
MMDFRFKRITSAVALFLALAVAHSYLPATFADSRAESNENADPVSLASPQQAAAMLTTLGNKPITLNGANAISGATVMTGAMIETPDQVGATVNLPGHFSLEISPNAKLSTDFSLSGIKVNLIQGCVVLNTKKGTTGEIATSRGVVAKADGSKDERLEVCDPSIATAPAAASAGLSPGGKIAIAAAIIGAISLIPILTGGGNPSPGSPRP